MIQMHLDPHSKQWKWHHWWSQQSQLIMTIIPKGALAGSLTLEKQGHDSDTPVLTTVDHYGFCESRRPIVLQAKEIWWPLKAAAPETHRLLPWPLSGHMRSIRPHVIILLPIPCCPWSVRYSLTLVFRSSQIWPISKVYLWKNIKR